MNFFQEFRTETKILLVVAPVAISLAVAGIFLLQAGLGPSSPTPATVPSPQPQAADTEDFTLSEAEGWQTYRNNEFGFEINYPQDMNAQEQQGEYTEITFRKTGRQLFKLFVGSNNTSLTNRKITYPAGQLDGFTSVERSKQEIGNHVWDVVTTESIPIEGRGTGGWITQFYTEKDNILYLIQCSSTFCDSNMEIFNTSSEDELSLFTDILSTFRFLEKNNSIREIDFASHLSSLAPYSECDEFAPPMPAVFMNNVEYFDVINDGKEEAIVIASSCYTGTAGPDIVGVYALNAAGELKTLQFKEGLQSHVIRWNPNKQALIGFTGVYEASDANCCPSKEKIVEYTWDSSVQQFTILSEEIRERVHRNKAFWDDDCYIDEAAC